MADGEAIPDGAKALGYHGGNLGAARALFPDAPEPWIDLSTGINPIAYPIEAVAADVWGRLPSDQGALEAAARAAYGARPAAEIVAAPGTQALIQWLPRVVPARRVGILGMTYGEHETCWRDAGAEVCLVETLADLGCFDVGVVVNPNNPDGRICAAERLAETARALAGRGGLLVVDEAFMDVGPGRCSLVPWVGDAECVVLRSFGKVYGLAGLRLGFAVASPRVGGMLRRAIGPWAVSGPAIAIGRRALADVGWLDRTVAWLGEAAERLDAVLRRAGFEVVGGTALFRLVRHSDAGGWFERLARAGILTRPFRQRPDWLRFGIPGAPAEWERLSAAFGGK